MNEWRELFGDIVVNFILEYCGGENVILPMLGDEVKVTRYHGRLKASYGNIAGANCPTGKKLKMILGKTGKVTGM